jgi:large subunit ribosomal protein L14e
MIDTGRVCIKTAGREKGLYCVVVEKVDDKFVIVSGPKSITRVRRRKCNIAHLDFLPEKFDIPEKADDSVIENAWKSSDLLKKFNISLKTKV